jgi:hypothetical protein
MFLINPVIAMLHNVKLNRWHPLVFEENPLPGPSPSVIRHKSKMHHTSGFESREEALKSIPELKEQCNAHKECLAKDIPWDGDGIPTMTAFFTETPEGLEPVFM